jgi:hypothetical protein
VLRAPLLSADYLFLRHRANKVGRLKKKEKKKRNETKRFFSFLFCLTCVIGESEKDKSVEKGQATGPIYIESV